MGRLAFASGPDAMARQAIEHGAIEVARSRNQSSGLRQGRFADPFGHHAGQLNDSAQHDSCRPRSERPQDRPGPDCQRIVG
jgi:hypothetical protein